MTRHHDQINLKRNHLFGAFSFRELEFVTNMAGKMVERQIWLQSVIESLCLDPQREKDNETRKLQGFETPEPAPSDIPP